MLELYQEGTPWWVSMSLAADADIVVPRPTNRGAKVAGTGIHNLEEYRLIILGFHYDYVAANGNGFDLEWSDTTTPGAAQRTIIASRATTAITAVQSGTAFCFIPGPGGQATPVENGASLRLNITATGPTSGRLLIWGIHVPAEWKPGKSFTGSPISF